MNKKYALELSNLVVHYGKIELLDAFEDRFYPLFSQNIERKTGETYLYTFIDMQFLEFENEVYICGRLVQKRLMRAHQQMTETNQLLESKDTMNSDCSSIFAIRLFDHKLLVIPEQPRSPKSSTFEFIWSKLAKREWDERFKIYCEEYRLEKKLKFLERPLKESLKKEFAEDYPFPNVTINPIGKPEKVGTILKAFAKVSSLHLIFNLTNNENYDADEELLQGFAESLKRTNSTTASQSFKNTKDGLNTATVDNLVTASTKTGGNCKFKIVGSSTEGTPINRTDEHTAIKPRLVFSGIPNLNEIVLEAVRVLKHLVISKQISLAETPRPQQCRILAARIKERLS